MPRLKSAKNTQAKKKCTKGFPCGYSCQPQGRKCKKVLEGQAATYQDWLKLSGAKPSNNQHKKEDDLENLAKKASTLADDDLHDLVLTDYPQIFKDYFSDFMTHASYDHFAMKAKHLRQDLASGWISQKYQLQGSNTARKESKTDKAFVPSARNRKRTEAVVSRYEGGSETKKYNIPTEWEAEESGFEKLGAGLAGTVYLDKKANVAIKYGNKRRTNKKEFALMDEASKVGIAPKLLGFKSFGNEIGAAIEYIEGKTPDFSSEKDGKAATLAFVKLHRLGIAHQDGHSQNMFVAKDGSVKLIDFGSAAKGWNSVGDEIAIPKKINSWNPDSYGEMSAKAGIEKERAEFTTQWRSLSDNQKKGVAGKKAINNYLDSIEKKLI